MQLAGLRVSVADLVGFTPLRVPRGSSTRDAASRPQAPCGNGDRRAALSSARAGALCEVRPTANDIDVRFSSSPPFTRITMPDSWGRMIRTPVGAHYHWYQHLFNELRCEK